MRGGGTLGYCGAVFTLLACIVAGQQMPACATECLESSLKAQDTCAPTNITCICTNEPLLGSIQGCVLSSCTLKQALAAQNATQTMCEQPIRDITHITPIVTGVSGGAALIAVIARCILVGKSFAMDDAFALVSLLSALPMGILEFFMSADGFGKDIWTIAPEKIYRIVKYTWLTEVFYFAAVAFTKMSFLCFCLRIFPRQGFRRLAYFLLATSLAYGIAFTVTCLFNCTPVSYIWTSWDGEHSGTCINFHIFAWAHAAVNIILDVTILVIPIPELLRLSMSIRKKLYIITMFSIGTFTTVVSIVRLQSLVKFATSSNPTYDSVPTAYWSVLEAFVGIFCICMPALRRFLARLFPACFASTQSDSRYRHYDDANDVGAHTPNKLSNGRHKAGSSGKPSLNSWKKFGVSGLDTGITKTMETRVESRNGGAEEDDDEVMLVEIERGRRRGGVRE